MKILTTYYSQTQHTKTVAEMITQELESSGKEMVLEEVTNVNTEMVTGTDFLIIGTPVHGLFIILQKPANQVFEFIKGLPDDLQGKPVIFFATYLLRAGGAMRKAEELIKQKNGKLLGSVVLHRNKKEEIVETVKSLI